MVRWAEFEAAAPEIAAEGRRLLYARGDGEALLVTVRGADLPRVHPINVGVIDGGLYAFLLPSPKRTDLERDGRFALHTHQDPAAPDEFSVRGRATVVDDPAARASGWRRVVLRGGRHLPARRARRRAGGPWIARRRRVAAALSPLERHRLLNDRCSPGRTCNTYFSVVGYLARPYVQIAAPHCGDRDTEHGRPPCP